MANLPLLQKILNNYVFSGYRWIDPTGIVVAQWVRMKCMYTFAFLLVA
jgi:hypothetical protein